MPSASTDSAHRVDAPRVAPFYERGLHRRLPAGARVLGGVVAVVGALIVLGWALGVIIVPSVNPQSPAVRLNTGICLTLAGVALALVASGRARAAWRALGAVVALIAALTLVEQIFGVDLGIDQVVFNDHSKSVGRMAPNTAAAFLVLGMALLLARPWRRRWALSEALAIGAALIGWLGLIGYAAALPDLLRVGGGALEIALPTSLCFVLLGVGIAVSDPAGRLTELLASEGPAGPLLRRLFMAVIVVPPLVALLLRAAHSAGMDEGTVVLILFGSLAVTLVGIAVSAGRSIDVAQIDRLRAQQRLRALLDSAPDATVVIDERGTIMMVSEQAQPLFGYRRDELLGRDIEILVPERYRAVHVGHRERFSSAPSARPMGARLELFAVRKDGIEVPVEISLSPLETDEGTVVSAAIRDITQRKRAQQLFTGLLESAPDAVVIVDRGGEIVLVNAQTEALFGYSRTELVGRPVEVLVPERLRERHGGHRSGFTAHPATRPMGAGLELLARRKDGSEFPVEISLSPVQTDTGMLLSAAIRDVTVRREAETELRLQAEIMRNMAEGVVLVRADDWTIAYANPKFEGMFGYGAGELTDRPVAAINASSNGDAPTVAATIQTALADHGAWSGEVHNVKKDGTMFWCQVNVSSFEHPDHGALWVKVHTDITERKAAEEERLRLAAVAAAADTLQRSILGPVDQELPDDVAARYQPAVRPFEVGGDWYDVIRLAAGRLGLIVGDCVGRGVEAAAVMGQLRSVSHSLMLQGRAPGEVLSHLDTFAQRVPAAHCTTVFCALIDPTARTVRYSSAGHPPAILTPRDGISELLDHGSSLPLAIEGAERREATAKLSPGCTLALYSDGLIERRGESLDDGLARLKRVIERDRHQGVESLAIAVMERMQAAGSEDDVALLLYRLPLVEPPRLAVTMPADPAKLSDLRNELRAWLQEAGYAEDADGVLLSVGEACSNAIEHAYGFDPREVIDIRAEIQGGRLSVTVADSGRWRRPDPNGTQRGRGLTLIQAFMDDYRIETGTGTTLHLRKDLSRER